MNEKSVFEKELEAYRKEIDKIDNHIIDLLNERGLIVQKIGKLKQHLKKDVYQPQREKEIIARIKEKSSILKPISIEAIWREIIKASKLIQDN